GTSAGGYAAARAILAYPNFYTVAVAASGTHEFRDYLAPWGDIYQGPVEPRAYEEASNLPLARNLRGKLLLAHGEMDDNVSPSQTMKLADALIKANQDFDFLLLPNVNHAIHRGPYFIRRKWDYFVHYLLDAEPPVAYAIAGPS